MPGITGEVRWEEGKSFQVASMRGFPLPGHTALKL